MGAGGATTAIAIQFAIDGASEIHIFNCDDKFYHRGVKNADILNNEIKGINCKATVIRIKNKELLKETVYNLHNTRLLEMAEEAGCQKAIDGLGMMIWRRAKHLNFGQGKKCLLNMKKNKYLDKQFK